MVKKAVMCLISLLFCLYPVYAEETPNPETDETGETEGTEEIEETEEEPAQEVIDIASGKAVLIDADSGKVLYEKNSNERGDPASLNKIMTVYLAAQSLSMTQPLTMSDTAFQSYDHSQGVLWIQQGETLPAKDCEYAAFLASANDTAAMLAEAAAGSLNAFVEKMNAEASELELQNTHFDNVFGVASSDNYSSAYDMAMLTRKALKNDAFREIFGSSSYMLAGTNKQNGSRMIAADCELIRSGSYFYEDAVGGKIGSTPTGGFALAAAAKRGATNLIAVVLGEETPDAAYRDIVRIFEYGFDSAQTVTITPADYGSKTIEVTDGKKHVADVVFTSDSTFSILMPKELDPSLLKAEIVVTNEGSVDPEEITAEVIFTLDGETIGSSPMERTIIMEPKEEKFKTDHFSNHILDWISVGALLLVFLLPALNWFFRILEPPK